MGHKKKIIPEKNLSRKKIPMFYYMSANSNNNPRVTNLPLYEKIKEQVNKQYKPSAYRSMLLVKRYKEAMESLQKEPYTGTKNKESGLQKWIRERWTNQRGETGYKYRSDVYRPTVRVDKTTPATFSELTQQELKKAREKKARVGRVNRFKEN